MLFWTIETQPFHAISEVIGLTSSLSNTMELGEAESPPVFLWLYTNT